MGRYTRIRASLLCILLVVIGARLLQSRPGERYLLAEPERNSGELTPAHWYDRVLRQFDKAALWKPFSDSLEASDPRFALAPLIVGEIPDTPPTGESGAPISTARPFDTGAVNAETSHPRGTLSVSSGTVSIAGEEYERYEYAWMEETRHLSFRHRLIRITADADGFPMIVEVVADHEADLIFVSRALESAAREAFGEPLPHRRFSIEKSVAQAPQTVVARVLEDGPVPMGPYVYVGKDNRVTTLLCRCSPAQVKEFAWTAEYTIRAGTGPRRLQAANEKRDVACEDFNGINPYVHMPLEERLRFPPGFGKREK